MTGAPTGCPVCKSWCFRKNKATGALWCPRCALWWTPGSHVLEVFAGVLAGGQEASTAAAGDNQVVAKGGGA